MRESKSTRPSSQAGPKLVIQLLVAYLLCTFAGLVKAQTASSETIFTSETTGNIYEINNATGVSTLLGTSGAFSGDFWNGAAYDTTTGMVYVSNIGTTNYQPNLVITNTIYMFNPNNVSAGLTEVGTIRSDAITGAGWHNGKYYVVGSGSNVLAAYTLPTSFSTAALTASSTQTLGGLGSGVTGLSLGDLDFIGNTLYISSGTVSSTAVNASVSAQYTLYKYADVSNVTTPVYAVGEGATYVGVGLGYDPLTNNLYMLNANNTIGLVNQSTGVESGEFNITGPDPGGAGDYTVLIGVVPESRDYAIICLGLILAMVASERILRQRRTCPA